MLITPVLLKDRTVENKINLESDPGIVDCRVNSGFKIERNKIIFEMKTCPKTTKENITEVQVETKKRLQSLWPKENNREIMNSKLKIIIKYKAEIREITEIAVKIENTQCQHWKFGKTELKTKN